MFLALQVIQFLLPLLDLSVAVQKQLQQNCPDGPVVKTLPCNAGDGGSIPGWGSKIPHAVEMLQLRSNAAKYINKY